MQRVNPESAVSYLAAQPVPLIPARTRSSWIHAWLQLTTLEITRVPEALWERPWRTDRLDSCLNMSLEKNNNKIDHVAHDTISLLVTFISACVSFWNPFFLAQIWVWPGYKSCLNCFTAGSFTLLYPDSCSSPSAQLHWRCSLSRLKMKLKWTMQVLFSSSVPSHGLWCAPFSGSPYSILFIPLLFWSFTSFPSHTSLFSSCNKNVRSTGELQQEIFISYTSDYWGSAGSVDLSGTHSCVYTLAGTLLSSGLTRTP